MTDIIRSDDHTEVSRDHRGLRTVLPSTATGGPPLHLHPTSDETFIVLNGALLVHLDGEVAHLGAGDVVHITRGTRHTFATPHGSGAHFLTLHTPGGFEDFHAAAADTERRRGTPLTPPERMSIQSHPPAATSEARRGDTGCPRPAAQRQPCSRAYYDRKRAEGKNHTAALTCLSRRRVDVLHAMIRDRQPYRREHLEPTVRRTEKTAAAA